MKVSEYSLNKVAIPNFNGLCSADAYPLLVNNNIANKIFVAFALRSDCFLNYILGLSSRTNIPKVNKVQLLGFKCICPTIELQNKFAIVVEKIEKQKDLLNKSLLNLEYNFNSLTNKAFNGELFNEYIGG